MTPSRRKADSRKVCFGGDLEGGRGAAAFYSTRQKQYMNC